MLQVRTGGLTPAAVWLQKLPTCVAPSLMSIVKIFVMSVPFGNVIVNWLRPAATAAGGEEVLNPIV